MTDEPNQGPFRLLFVCTGNTCRSPMAEVIARRRVEALGWEHVEVQSAGVAATHGSPASGGAVRAAALHGLDLAGHRSTFLTPALVAESDLILTMSLSHLARVIELGGADRAALITAFAEIGDATGAGEPGVSGVPDPIGGADEEYQHTFRVLDALVERVLELIQPVVSP